MYRHSPACLPVFVKAWWVRYTSYIMAHYWTVFPIRGVYRAIAGLALTCVFFGFIHVPLVLIALEFLAYVLPYSSGRYPSGKGSASREVIICEAS